MTVKYFTQFCNFWHRSFATCLLFHGDQSFSFILIINEIEVIIWHQSPASNVPDIVKIWPKNSLDLQFFWTKIIHTQRNFDTKYKKILIQIIFWPNKAFGLKNLLEPIFFGPKIVLDTTFFLASNQFLIQIIFDNKIFLNPHFIRTNYFFDRIILGLFVIYFLF